MTKLIEKTKKNIQDNVNVLSKDTPNSMQGETGVTKWQFEMSVGFYVRNFERKKNIIRFLQWNNVLVWDITYANINMQLLKHKKEFRTALT